MSDDAKKAWQTVTGIVATVAKGVYEAKAEEDSKA